MICRGLCSSCSRRWIYGGKYSGPCGVSWINPPEKIQRMSSTLMRSLSGVTGNSIDAAAVRLFLPSSITGCCRVYYHQRTTPSCSQSFIDGVFSCSQSFIDGVFLCSAVLRRIIASCVYVKSFYQRVYFHCLYCVYDHMEFCAVKEHVTTLNFVLL